MPSILEELKQSRPFPTKAQEAAVSLLRTAELVRRSVTVVLEAHDVTLQQYNVLRILRGAGDDGLPTLEIVERLIEETPGITRLIDRLESKHLVSRERCTTDRRQVFCRIRPAGIALLDRLEAPLAAVEETALGSLKKRELNDLISLLDRTREALHESIARQRALNRQRLEPREPQTRRTR